MTDHGDDTRRHLLPSRVERRSGRWKRATNAGATTLKVTAVTVLLILNCFCPLSAAASSSSEEKQALLAFKETRDNGGPESWNEDDEVCRDWRHVECNSDDQVTSLRFYSYDEDATKGSAPIEFGELEHLETLEISHLYGTLPPQWSKLQNLETMDVAGQGLVGTLPESWSTMEKLESMLLSGNMTGTLPGAWSTLESLRSLDIQAMRLSKNALPKQWSKLHGLKYMTLTLESENGEDLGELPKEWGEGMTTLHDMTITSDRISGGLPKEWSRLQKLKYLTMRVKDMVGSLPPEWGNLKNLMRMRLYSFPGLTGALPAEWSNLKDSLLFLDIPGPGRLEGTLPPEWSALSSLSWMKLPNNKITGELPKQWSALTRLSELDLSSNKLTDDLPVLWSAMEGLSVLDLGGNLITGQLPQHWTNLSRLMLYMSLNNNRLSGIIPSGWENFDMRLLNVSDNCLTGGVPESIDFPVAYDPQSQDRCSKAYIQANAESGSISDDSVAGNITNKVPQEVGASPVIGEELSGDDSAAVFPSAMAPALVSGLISAILVYAAMIA